MYLSRRGFINYFLSLISGIDSYSFVFLPKLYNEIFHSFDLFCRCHSRAYRPCFSNSSECLPSSTMRPLSKTIILSAFFMVFKRWAIMMTVLSLTRCKITHTMTIPSLIYKFYNSILSINLRVYTLKFPCT